MKFTHLIQVMNNQQMIYIFYIILIIFNKSYYNHKNETKIKMKSLRRVIWVVKGIIVITQMRVWSPDKKKTSFLSLFFFSIDGGKFINFLQSSKSYTTFYFWRHLQLPFSLSNFSSIYRKQKLTLL